MSIAERDRLTWSYRTRSRLIWDGAWLQRCHDNLNQATRFLDRAGSRLT